MSAAEIITLVGVALIPVGVYTLIDSWRALQATEAHITEIEAETERMRAVSARMRAGEGGGE